MNNPITAPRSPRTGEPLHPVPIGATIPGDVEWYERDSGGRIYGPYIFASDFHYYEEEDYTYWTEEPIPDPEPEKGAPALVGWWDALTDDQRAAYTALDAEQAGDLAELLPRVSILVDTRIADAGLTPVLHDLTSGDRGIVQGAIADLIEAWLLGDL